MRLVLGINAAGDMRLRLLHDRPVARPSAAVGAGPLVCCSKLQELTTEPRHRVPVGFGRISTRNRLTKEARTRLREAGAILDAGNRNRCLFLTGTLPGGSTAALDALAAWSGWVVQSIKQWIRDYAPDSACFGVWEYQKRGALHLHLCVRTAIPEHAKLLRSRWKDRWIKLMDSISERSGVDVYERAGGGTWASEKWRTRTDAQFVEKSVGNYLAKYLSKGSGKSRRRCESPPSSWSFLSGSVRKEIKEARKVQEVEHLSLSQGIELWERVGAVVVAQGRIACGYLGRFDCQIKGLIALLKPVEASLLFNNIAPVLNCLLSVDRQPDWDSIPDISQIARLFGARRIRPAPS